MSSIAVAGLGWSTPSGKVIFSELDVSFGRERTGLVGNNGVGKTSLLKIIAGEIEPTSGKIWIDGTLGVLRQTVQIRPDETIADLFGVAEAVAVVRRAEAGEATMDELSDVDWTLEDRILAAVAKVGLEGNADTPLIRFSGGERTRAGLAAAIFAEPDFLLFDEPTNNLDSAGRQDVIALLSNWKAGAVVISHDRELLEAMDAIVELTTLGGARYGGGWSHYRERKAVELEAAEQDLLHAEKEMAQAQRKAQVVSERKDRRDAAGARKGARGDMPRILAGARKNAAESSSGAGARLLERQKDKSLEAVSAARARIELVQKFAIRLPPTGLGSDRAVLSMSGVSASYDAGTPLFRNLGFSIRGPEKVAIVGPNGSGKSTLLKLISGQMRPTEGRISVGVEFALLDQRVDILDSDTSILANFLRLNPGSTEQMCRAVLANFLFRADAALQPVATLSGGQTLRAGLACVLGLRPPQLLMLDEPTNHLDISAVEALEACLGEFDGALLVVSHDREFLRRAGVDRFLAVP